MLRIPFGLQTSTNTISSLAAAKDNTSQLPYTLDTQTQSTPGSPSPRVYESSQESQLDGTAHICPDMTGVDIPVATVLPDLTSSLW